MFSPYKMFVWSLTFYQRAHELLFLISVALKMIIYQNKKTHIRFFVYESHSLLTFRVYDRDDEMLQEILELLPHF